MDGNDKYQFIHATFKTVIHTIVAGVSSTLYHALKYHKVYIVSSREDIRTEIARKLWDTWELGFEKWERDLLTKGELRKRKVFKELDKLKNIILTIIDNDGAYQRAVVAFGSAWDEVNKR